ncbi:hypothetical protein DFH06DRAFT_160987 [Mycena polygramma]|nr:hypothetical protein DFH06DRAFT_160987 [Mycena polygramma]
MPRVPSETSDIIIDYLHDDVPTLRQCSLVCTEWLPAARFHIFSVVHLSLYSIDQMLQVVFYPGSPMPQYIRHLSVIDGQGREFYPEWVNEKFAMVPVSSMTCISSLSLEQVSFSGLSIATMDALRGIMAQIIRLELMSYVRFEDLDSYLGFLGSAVSLRSLTSCITGFGDESSSPHPAISTILPELVELEMENDDDPILLLISSLSSPPRIRAVTLYLGADNIPAVAGFLGCLGSSLTHLHIQSIPFDQMALVTNVSEDIDLSKNPNLKTIIFENNSSECVVKMLNTAAPTLERVYMQPPPEDLDFLSLRRLFLQEGSALRRTEVVFSGARCANTEWLETEPRRIQVQDEKVSLRDFRPEFM